MKEGRCASAIVVVGAGVVGGSCKVVELKVKTVLFKISKEVSNHVGQVSLFSFPCDILNFF